MRKFLSDRNIAVALFVFTFLLFVLAQQYTLQNSRIPHNQVVSGKSTVPAAEEPAPAVIIVR